MKNIVKKGIVVALMLSGISGFAQIKTGEKGKNPEKAKLRMETMIKDLGLSADQATKVKAIFNEEREGLKADKISKEEMSQLPDEDRKIENAKQRLSRAESAKLINAKLKEVLSEEQMAKYDAIKKQKQDQRKEFRKENMEHKPGKPDMHQKEPKSNG